MNAHGGLFTVIVMALAILLFCGCGSDSSGPSKPDDGNGSTSAEVLETRTAAVGASGASITLTGVELAIPADAVASEQQITIERLEPSSLFDGDSTNRAVVRVEGTPDGFAVPVELRVTLPDGVTEADSSYIFAGLIDDESGAVTMEPCAFRMIDGKPTAVVTATHFSSRFIEWLVGKTPPAARTLEIPYYNQGSEPFCWAASVHMAAAAAGGETTDEIVDIIGRMGVDEGGITSFSFRYSPTLSSIVRSRTGVSPNRSIWDYINVGQMKYYMRREIGNEGRPVALFNGAWNHAVLVVGYDGGTFYIHDPASLTPSSIGTTAKTWNDIVGKMGPLTNMVTLAIPKALNSSRPHVTVGFESGGISFVKPSTGTGDKSQFFQYDWDHTESSGFSFRNNSNGEKTSPLPGNITTMNAKSLWVYNSSLSSSHEVSVTIDITCLAQEGRHYSHNERITVGPNTASRVPMPPITVDEFRYNGTSASKYYISVRAMVGGTTTDEESMTIEIDPVTIDIKSMAPETGASGSDVLLKGSGFGSHPRYAELHFGDTIVSVDSTKWSDTQIFFTVPQGIAEGTVPVQIIRDEAKSNKKFYTISPSVTLTGTYERTKELPGDRKYECTLDWSATGLDLIFSEDTITNSYWFKARQYSSMRLTVDASFEANFPEYRTEWTSGGDQYYTITTYSDIHLAEMPPAADEDSDPHDVVRVYGRIDHTFSGGGGNYTIDMTLSDDWHAQTIQLLIWCVYDSFEQVYKITEEGEELIREINRDDQSFIIIDFNLTTTKNN